MNARQPPGHVMHGHLAVIAKAGMVDHRRVFHAQFLNRPFVHLGSRGAQAGHRAQPFGAGGHADHLGGEVGGVFQHVLEDGPQLGAAVGNEGLALWQRLDQIRIAQFDAMAPGDGGKDVARIDTGPPDRQPTRPARAQGPFRDRPNIALRPVFVGINRPTTVHDFHRGDAHGGGIARRAALHRHVIAVAAALPLEMHAVVVQRDA